MANFKGLSFAGQIKLLMEAEPDFPKKFKQRLVFESSKVANPFKFIAGLLSKGLLSDEPNDSDSSFGLMMVQLAASMVCSKGVDAIGGLMEALEESENLQLVSALRTWAKEEFGIVTDDDLSEQEEADSVVHASTSGIRQTQAQKTIELNSSTIKLIDKLTFPEGQEFLEQLTGHLVAMAPRVVNSEEFCSSLDIQILHYETEVQVKSVPELQAEQQRVALTIKIACLHKQMGSLVVALQQSGNELIIEETLDWLETAQARNKNYPIAVKSLANQRVNQVTKFVRSSFFEQPASPNGLEKVATFNCQPDSFSKRILELKFDKKRMMACFDDCTAKVWNWRDGKETTIKFGVQVKNITCIQCDDEILILHEAGRLTKF